MPPACAARVGEPGVALSWRARATEVTMSSPGASGETSTEIPYASFKEPDGTGWLLQEVTTRLPGRVWDD
jgi:hypothetical protein